MKKLFIFIFTLFFVNAEIKAESIVDSSEYKILYKTSLVAKDYEQDISKMQELIIKNAETKRFKIKPVKIKLKERERNFYDTSDFIFAKNNMILRITNKKGKTSEITIKTQEGENLNRAKTRNIGENSEVETSIESGIYIDKNGQRKVFYEKSFDVEKNLKSVSVKDLGEIFTYFNTFKNVPLIEYKAYSYKTKVAELDINGEKIDINAEIWAKVSGEKPFVFEISFGIEDINNAKLLSESDRFLSEVLYQKELIRDDYYYTKTQTLYAYKALILDSKNLK